MLATKPPMQMGGFFIAKTRNKLAWLSGWAIKKPNEHVVFVWKALGKVPTEEVVLSFAKNDSPEALGKVPTEEVGERIEPTVPKIIKY